MSFIQYGESVSFDHEPSEAERKAAAHDLAIKLLPHLESDCVIFQKDTVGKDRWTLGVKFLIQI